jgi:hypothetical protein
MSMAQRSVVGLLGAALAGACQSNGSVKLTQSEYKVSAGESSLLTVAVSGQLKSATWKIVDAPQCRGSVEKVGQASARFKAPSECAAGGTNLLELEAAFESGDRTTLSAKVNVSPKSGAPQPAIEEKATEPREREGGKTSLQIVPVFDREIYRDLPAKGFLARSVVRLDSLDVKLRNVSGQGWGVVCVEHPEKSVDLTRYETISVELGPAESEVAGKGKLEIKLERPDIEAEYGGKILDHLALPLAARAVHTFKLSGVDAPLLADTKRICISSDFAKLQGGVGVRLYKISFK